jgi:hypothetical protein
LEKEINGKKGRFLMTVSKKETGNTQVIVIVALITAISLLGDASGVSFT